MLTGGGAPYPVVFGAEDVHETMKLNAVQGGADEALEACRNITGFRPESWVPTNHYEEAMSRNKHLKAGALAAVAPADERG